jgi:hypothetical protein
MIKKHQITFIFLFVSSFSYGQFNNDSLIVKIDHMINQGHFEIFSKYDDSQPCKIVYYSQRNKLKKIEIGCGDVSINRGRMSYYFNSSIVLYIEELTYYNAPPYYTKEVAEAEGVTSGWFNPEKTRIEIQRCYFQNGKMVSWVTEKGERINPVSEEFKTRENSILKKIERLKRIR